MQVLSECITDLEDNILVVVCHRGDDLELVCDVGERPSSEKDERIVRRLDRNRLDRLP